jgi:tetratricopeptide (TPR) repeat protein
MVARIERLKVVVAISTATMLALCTTAASAQDNDAARERAKNGVVMIKSKWPTQSASGAGTVVAVSGQDVYIVTARHVINADGVGAALTVEVEFKARPKEWYTARALAGEAGSYDIAALRVALPAGLRAEQITGGGIAPPTATTRGTDVFPVGFPEGTEWSDPVRPDKVSTVGRDNITFQSQFVREGHSGGPLLDSCGRVVGMVVERRPPEATALPIDLIVDRLKSWSVPTSLMAVHASACAVDAGNVTPGPTAPTATDVRRMHRSEQWRDSLPILNRLIAEQPRNAELLTLRSHAYSHLDQKIEALRDGEQAVLLAPKSAEAYVRRGEAKSSDNRYPEAIADYDKAIALDKNEAEAWGNKGSALSAIDQNQKALEALNRAITLQNGRYEFWAVRGQVNSSLNNFSAAISDFNEAIRLRPEETALLVARASAYANARQYEPALTDANQALKLKPDDPDILTVRGNIYALLGRTQAAKDDLSFALRLNPNVRFAAELLKRLEPAPGAGANAGGRAGGGGTPAAGGGASMQYARLLDDTAAALRTQRTSEASELLDQMIRLDGTRSEAWSLKGTLAMNNFDNLPAAHENFENALSRGGTIFFRVGHDHGSELAPCFGMMGLSPAGVTYSGETGHKFNWPLEAISEASLNGFYGVLLGMFHIRAQASGRPTTFNFAVVRHTDAQVVNRRPDAEMLVGFINRLRQARLR